MKYTISVLLLLLFSSAIYSQNDSLSEKYPESKLMYELFLGYNMETGGDYIDELIKYSGFLGYFNFGFRGDRNALLGSVYLKAHPSVSYSDYSANFGEELFTVTELIAFESGPFISTGFLLGPRFSSKNRMISKNPVFSTDIQLGVCTAYFPQTAIEYVSYFDFTETQVKSTIYNNSGIGTVFHLGFQLGFAFNNSKSCFFKAGILSENANIPVNGSSLVGNDFEYIDDFVEWHTFSIYLGLGIQL